MTIKSTLICATAIAIALTSFDLRPAAAAPQGGPAYGYYAPPAYQYSRPAYQHRDYYSRWGGSGGQPGYHGPNVNVPGPTNYGNAAGQNGQMPPLVTNPANP